MSERTDRYFARLDAHLATLADDQARVELLEAQRGRFEWEYGAFLSKLENEDEEAARSDGPDVYDYVLTIAELSARINRLRAA